MTAPESTRLAHISDIHVSASSLGWKAGDIFGKRAASWVNHRVLGRAWRFRHAIGVLEALRADLDERRPDHVVFSGDATAMGFEREVQRAAELLPLSWPGLAVPGNHDYCTASAMHSGAFERHFSGWQTGERIDDEIYPFAQRVGGIWLVAVNSATANRFPWDARGRVGKPQLDRLGRLLDRLNPAPRILVTHYPIARACGRPEGLMRELRDLQELIEVARQGFVSLWLHGHRHDSYDHRRSHKVPISSFCAGSTTQSRRWSYGEYIIRGHHLSASQRVFDPATNSFLPGRTFEIDLRVREEQGVSERFVSTQ